MVSSVKTHKMLIKGCIKYLIQVINKSNFELPLSVGNTPMVCEFFDVFMDKLLEAGTSERNRVQH